MSESTKRKILFAVLIILLIILLGLIWLISRQINQARLDVGRSPAASETSLATSTTSANVNISYDLKSPSATSTEKIALDAAKDVANKFMQAKNDRSFDEAKIYMTEELQGKFNQETFSGTSSPSMDRFEISSAKKLDDNTYQVSVTSYWLLSGADAGTVKYQLELVKKDDDFKVNKFDEVS